MVQFSARELHFALSGVRNFGEGLRLNVSGMIYFKTISVCSEAVEVEFNRFRFEC